MKMEDYFNYVSWLEERRGVHKSDCGFIAALITMHSVVAPSRNKTTWWQYDDNMFMPVAIQNRMAANSMWIEGHIFNFMFWVQNIKSLEVLSSNFPASSIDLTHLSLSLSRSRALVQSPQGRAVLCVVGSLFLKMSEVWGTGICEFPLSVFCACLQDFPALSEFVI